ncbi:hypothetical protein ACQKDM_28430, partial [Serratia proteamaculans]
MKMIPRFVVVPAVPTETGSTRSGSRFYCQTASPAAAAYLEPLAQRAQQLTRQRFGNVVSFYVP